MNAQLSNGPLLPPEEQVLSTLNADGTRRWLRPRLSRGRLLNLRRIVGYGLILLFTVLPYVRIEGRPAMLLDVARREFTFLGTTFYATDTVLLALLLLSIFVAIFLLTALAGRIWCGWGCPQTVYMELVYRPIERLFEGRRYTTGGRASIPPWRIVAKYVVFLLLSLFLAHTFLAYFVGVDRLWDWMRQSPLEHPGAFLLVMAVTGLMMLDFAFMREQVCILMCPYGRLQSVLLDRQSLIVSYDPKRGEPRGRRPKGQDAGLGDCIDCYRCVATCPTGIDIRNGLQMECVHCAQCIDACNEIMDHVGKPHGLIRYSSQESMETGRQSWLRPRLVVYPLILLAALSLLGVTLARRIDFESTVLRNPNMTYRLDGDRVENIVQLKLRNRTRETQTYDVSIDEGDFETRDFPMTLDGGETGDGTLHVGLPATAFEGGRAELELTIEASSGDTDTVRTRVLGPLYAPSGERDPEGGDR